MNPKHALLLRREQAVAALPPFSQVVRGSLIERQIRCGKPRCRCASGQGHHVWYLTVSFARGRTEQITVPPELVSVVKRWVDNYQAWWNSLEEVSAVNRTLLRKRWVDPEPGTGR